METKSESDDNSSSDIFLFNSASEDELSKYSANDTEEYASYNPDGTDG